MRSDVSGAQAHHILKSNAHHAASKLLMILIPRAPAPLRETLMAFIAPITHSLQVTILKKANKRSLIGHVKDLIISMKQTMHSPYGVFPPLTFWMDFRTNYINGVVKPLPSC